MLLVVALSGLVALLSLSLLSVALLLVAFLNVVLLSFALSCLVAVSS